jgi:hypothetical protein
MPPGRRAFRKSTVLLPKEFSSDPFDRDTMQVTVSAPKSQPDQEHLICCFRAWRDTCKSLILAGVAQLVEHLICNQRVGGSNPSASSI